MHTKFDIIAKCPVLSATLPHAPHQPVCVCVLRDVCLPHDAGKAITAGFSIAYASVKLQYTSNQFLSLSLSLSLIILIYLYKCYMSISWRHGMVLHFSARREWCLFRFKFPLTLAIEYFFLNILKPLLMGKEDISHHWTKFGGKKRATVHTGFFFCSFWLSAGG